MSQTANIPVKNPINALGDHNENILPKNEKWNDFPKEMKLSRYLISDTGKIWSKYYNKYIKGTILPSGYLGMNLSYDDGKHRSVLQHRIIACALIPNPQNKKTIDHIDRNKTNNSIDNLRWATHTEQSNNKNKINYCKIYRKVDQYTMDGKYIKTWNSAQEASSAMTGSESGGTFIGDLCHGIYKNGYGFTWKYTPIENITGEIWKKIPDINGYYASNLGRIKKDNSNNEELLTGSICGKYHHVCIRKQYYQTHILICCTFNGKKPQSNYDVNHKNGNTLDNCSSNLEWISHGDNMKHASKSGLINCKKISISKQRKIRKYTKNGEFICEYSSISIASKEEKIDRSSIGKVCSGTPGHDTVGGFKWKYTDV